ncbi:phosphoribosyltransferase family protein [Lysinibacillus piscis]|uniref:Adenine/guanine phosphoribosyltransferase n=1 Tax=Lysinibacillus piscis TaxID=2518931 RepID=A0ABQ5NPL2_9BACI|nr:phosphoribosyltransferase family protein [Lysinibacillus sp. KH24]GLC90285.1 hypothetical protein LYSBPC_34120 [Lysinibacillus sp. KH24]
MQKNKYTILPNYEIDITVTHNPYLFAPTDLFQMAARINKKRQFLFVSTVLGKHLAVRPQIPLLTGALLATMYYQQRLGQEVEEAVLLAQALKEGLFAFQPAFQLPEATLFIGFAETATALGHAVFDTFCENAMYIHTTREFLPDIEPFVTFEEEHSHATSHRIYAVEPERLMQAQRIVLIDDEITTGNTIINIVETLRKKFPHVKHYTVLSILDWRSEQQQAYFMQLEQQWDIEIHFLALMRGYFHCQGEPVLTVPQPQHIRHDIQQQELIDIEEPMDKLHYRSIAENGTENQQPYLVATGRFLLTAPQQRLQKETCIKVAEQLKKLRTTGPALVIGTGEFMYVPMQIAATLGDQVYFQSTTRSPIYCTNKEEYTIKEKIAFDSPENNGIVNYLYNIQNRPYSELFLIVERIANKEIVAQTVSALQSVSTATIHVVCMTGGIHDETA